MQFEIIELNPSILPSHKMVDMVCQHCHIAVHGQQKTVYFGKDADGDWAVSGILCPRPECKRFSLYLSKGTTGLLVGGDVPPEMTFSATEPSLIRPKVILPNPIPPDTPEGIKKDYIEATMVLALSPNASGALSRRCLQDILRERAAREIENFQEGYLYEEIEQVIRSEILSPNLSGMLHGVRIVGNFSAHSSKSKLTNLIMPVEPDEAEFNLQVIDKLLFYFYVQRPKDQKVLDAINKKEQERERNS